MQSVEQRHIFVSDVNAAFSAVNIAKTADRLQSVLQNEDALDYMHRLELFPWLRRDQHERYRSTLRIPTLNMHILTIAFRSALSAKPPVPVSLDIVEGEQEAVSVTIAPAQISIKLTRTSFEPELPRD